MNTLSVVQMSPQEMREMMQELIQQEFQKLSLIATENNHAESPEDKTYLTRKETAELLGVSVTTINDWSKKGILRRIKLGNRSYFLLKDIYQSLEKSNQSTDP